MCQESEFPARALPLFVYTVSAARLPVLPLRSPVFDVALLILIGTKITSIFPFSTVFCTYHARAAPALFHPCRRRRRRMLRFRRVARTVPCLLLQHAHGFREFRDSEIEELHLRNVSCVFIFVTLPPPAA